MLVYVAVDVDETISSGAKSLARHYLQQLKLPVDEEVIASLSCYQEVMRLPVLVNFCRTSTKQMVRFEEVQQGAPHIPEVIAGFEPMAGAQQGTRFLAEQGDLAYYTVRSPQVVDVTYAWLRTQEFVNPDAVFFCRSSLHKLLLLSERQEHCVLIDDRWEQVLHAYARLEESMRDTVRTRVTLVGFGAKEICADSDLRLFALPAWKHVEKDFSLWTQHIHHLPGK